MANSAATGWTPLKANHAARFALEALEGTLGELLEMRPVARAKNALLHDAVWGTIALRAHEMALLDSPLFQRLRHIRQLGGTYMVFPSAVHTRFEHTVGVVGLVHRMASALRDKTSIDARMLENLRFAAMCHDIGHGPFSHCSEPFMAELEPMPAVLAMLPDSRAGEAMSWLIVTSAPMRALVEKLNMQFGANLDCDLAASIITGRMPPQLAFLGEMLHGALDADKLDYLSRDALFCGLHAQVDVDRLLATIDIDETSGSGTADKRSIVCAIDSLPALLQLVQHKIHLNCVAYHHTVARSFACMLDAALRIARNDTEPVCGVCLETAADLLRLDDFAALSGTPLPGGEAGDLLLRLRQRRLHKCTATVRGDNIATEELLHACESQCELAQEAPAWTTRNLLSPATIPSFNELHSLYVRHEGKLISLGDTLPFPQLLDALLPYIDNILLFSPAEHATEVRRLAQEILSSAIPNPATRTRGAQ